MYLVPLVLSTSSALVNRTTSDSHFSFRVTPMAQSIFPCLKRDLRIPLVTPPSWLPILSLDLAAKNLRTFASSFSMKPSTTGQILLQVKQPSQTKYPAPFSYRLRSFGSRISAAFFTVTAPIGHTASHAPQAAHMSCSMTSAIFGGNQFPPIPQFTCLTARYSI